MPIEVRIDDRVRTVSSAMLLTDFVHENEQCGRPHPLKTRTIEHLSPFTDHPCAVAARELSPENFMHRFHSYALVLPEPIDGAYSREQLLAGEPFNAFDEADFGPLLYQFCADTDLPALWENTRAEWATARKDCADIVGSSRLEEFIDLFFGKTDLRLILLPDPLDPPTFGFGPSDGCNCYSILGAAPTSDSNPSGRYANYREMMADTAFHEFSHGLWSATRKAYPAILDETAELEGTMEYRGYFPKSYDDWGIKLDEIVIRAATAHYVAYRDGDDKVLTFLEHEKQEYGITLIDTVYGALAEYLEARKRGEYAGLSEFVPALSEIMRASTE